MDFHCFGVHYFLNSGSNPPVLYVMCGYCCLFSDLSVGLLNVLTDIIWRITVTWEAGNLACKCIKFTQCMVTFASTYVLVALSIDRYDAITHPMNFSGSWKRAKVLVISAWIMSGLFSTPQFILYEETLIQGKDTSIIKFYALSMIKSFHYYTQKVGHSVG